MRIIETPLYAWQVCPGAQALDSKKLDPFSCRKTPISGKPPGKGKNSWKMSNLPICGIRDFLSTTSSVVPVDSRSGHD